MTYDWHPLAWEIARRASLSRAEDCTYASVVVADGTILAGQGDTSDAACHDLARQLTQWAGR